MGRLYLELELVSLEDGSEHPFDYIKNDMKEFFENFGWKVVTVNDEGLSDEDTE